jgi:hypothetical protein
MGDDDEAKRINYSLEVRGNGRKLTWKGVPCRITDSHMKVHESHDGIIIQRNMALIFSCSDKKKFEVYCFHTTLCTDCDTLLFFCGLIDQTSMFLFKCVRYTHNIN